MTLLQIIESGFVGKTVRFSNIPAGQRWIEEYVVKIEAVEFDINDDDSFVSAQVVLDFKLCDAKDGESLRLFDVPLETVSIEEVKD